MTGVEYIKKLAKKDWHTETEILIRQAVKDAANLLDRNLQFKNAQLKSDDRWHVSIRDADTGGWPPVSFVKPPNANQDWYTQEIVSQLRKKLK